MKDAGAGSSTKPVQLPGLKSSKRLTKSLWGSNGLSLKQVVKGKALRTTGFGLFDYFSFYQTGFFGYPYPFARASHSSILQLTYHSPGFNAAISSCEHGQWPLALHFFEAIELARLQQDVISSLGSWQW